MIPDFKWNEEKNRFLKQERGVSFEQIVTHLLQGDLLAVEEHPNQEKYPGQKYLVASINE